MNRYYSRILQIAVYAASLTLLSRVTPARAADGLTLDEALKEAFQSSPKIAKSKSQADQASARSLEAWSGFLPTVTASGTYLFDHKYLLTDVTLPGSPAPLTIPNVVPTSSFGLNAVMPIFDGLANINTYRGAHSLAAAADDDYDWTRFQAEREIKTLYFRAIAARALKEVAAQNVTTLNDHLRDVKNFKSAGISTNFDVLRVEVQVSSAQSDLLDATDNVEIAKNKLIEAIGKDVEVREISGELPVPDPKWADGIRAYDATERKDITSLQYRSEGLARLNSARAAYWMPHISLFGQYLTYNNRNDNLTDWDKYRGSYQVGLSASWVLFDGLASISRSRVATEEKVQAEKSLRIAQLHGKQDFEAWRRKFLYQCSVYKARLSDVAKANESVRLAKAGQKAGVRTNTDLLDAESELYRAKAGLVGAQNGATEAVLNLELATGRKIADLK